MKPLISIGMPVKNGFKINSKQGINLEKSLNSILNQSYSNLEIVISNDCSDDQTGIFLEKISKLDKRIKLFNQKDTLGLGPNFSFVLKKSSGEYFKWNAQDDLISEDYIENNLNYLQNNPDYICSSSKFFYEGKTNNPLEYNLDGSLFERIKNFFKIRHNAHNLTHSLIKKEFMIKAIDFSNDFWAIDWIFGLNLLIMGKFKTIEKGSVIFGTDGMSRQKKFVKRKVYNKKKIYNIFPYYELMKDLFLKTIFLKEMSIFEKITIYYYSFKINLYYFLKKFNFL